MMSKDKYLSIFLRSNGGYCVYYPSNIFRNMGESRGNRQDLPFCFVDEILCLDQVSIDSIIYRLELCQQWY